MILKSIFTLILAAMALNIDPERESPADFKSEQLKFPRVRKAYHEKEETVLSLLKQKSISSDSLEIFLRIFKHQQTIELWGRSQRSSGFIHIKDYPFCSTSGNLGPKRMQGDNQIPEGFYILDRFNPTSNFYLSLGISYPNKSDLILGDSRNPGGDIFIHGNCVTIGCIPVTDDLIKELYVFAVEAKDCGQRQIAIHIFPDKLDDQHFNQLCERYNGDRELKEFWQNLKGGYDYFENNRIIPSIEISNSGKYIFK